MVTPVTDWPWNQESFMEFVRGRGGYSRAGFWGGTWGRTRLLPKKHSRRSGRASQTVVCDRTKSVSCTTFQTIFFFQIKNALCKLKMNKYQSLFCYIVFSSNIFYLLLTKILVFLVSCWRLVTLFTIFCMIFVKILRTRLFFFAVDNQDARMQTTLREDRWKQNEQKKLGFDDGFGQ